MRHLVKGRKLNRTKSHREAMFKNMATSLFEHKKLHTTEAKAKELKPIAEKLITKAKNALANEKQNLLPEGQTVDIHNRRQVGRFIRNKAVLQELFDAIAPVVEGRNGGYTRVVKTGTRRGDAARTAVIELVDWGAPQDGTISNKPAKRKRDSQKKKSSSKESNVAKTTTKEEVEEKVETQNEEVATVETATEETEATTTEATAEDTTSETGETSADTEENQEKEV